MTEIGSIIAPASPEARERAKSDWVQIELGSGGFSDRLAAIEARLASPGVAELRFATGAPARNNLGTLHGAFLIGMVEQTLFLPMYLSGAATAWSCVTVDCSVQYVAPGNPDEPVHGCVELLKTTKRLAFVRGTFRQSQGVVTAFSGALRHGVKAQAIQAAATGEP